MKAHDKKKEMAKKIKDKYTEAFKKHKNLESYTTVGKGSVTREGAKNRSVI